MARKSHLALKRLRAIGVLALTSASACRTLAVGGTPAVLVAPSATVHAELVAALTAALGAAPVAVAPDALTQTSVLIIDRASPRPANPALTGRTLATGGAQRFVLILDGPSCVLTRPADGWRMRLPSAECRTEAR